ncbi:MAG: hypothetical protein GY774_04395 [Planctomycetes bacterium]|nr:hypothetical protein [Planctomycetota bacterium]
MRKYSQFLSEGGGIMLQHPDNPDALADGNTLKQALKTMHQIENNMGLEHLADQLLPQVLIERAGD